MSYLVTRKRSPVARRNRRRAPKQALGGLLSDIWNVSIVGAITNTVEAFTSDAQSIDSVCSGVGSQIVSLYTGIANVGTNWNPAGNFAPTDFYWVLQQGGALLTTATGIVNQVAAVNNTDDISAAMQQIYAMNDQWENLMIQYQQAMGSTPAPTVLASQDLKPWIINSMVAALNALAAAGAAACSTSVWQIAYASISASVTLIYQSLLNIKDVVVSAADTVANIASGAFNFLAWLEQYGVYVALGIGALWLYSSYEKGHSAR